ncbi:MAG: flavodoxin family protein [Desulfobacterales bacterium]|nr:MAG: flavodoxin family protein [Desulfobacterales bacterium]
MEKATPNIVAVYGSPRRNGNTATLLKKAVEGARDCGAQVEEIVLRDLRMSPCLEIYGCKHSGECRIRDDFQHAREQILTAQGLILASPIFFYTVSAHTKILMDRFQSLWVKKYWVEGAPGERRDPNRKGLFIAVGATRGKKLFDGTLLSIRYFFDVLDMQLWKSLLYRGLDLQGDVLKFPAYLAEAYQTGQAFARALQDHASG